MLLHKPIHLAVPLAFMFATCALPQSSTSSLPNAPAPSIQSQDDPVTLRSTPRHFLEDQQAIWTSPARIRESNALGPIALVGCHRRRHWH